MASLVAAQTSFSVATAQPDGESAAGQLLTGVPRAVPAGARNRTTARSTFLLVALSAGWMAVGLFSLLAGFAHSATLLLCSGVHTSLSHL